MSDVPMINGKPAVKVHFDAREKIGLPNYSNVDLGASITRYYEDTGPENDVDNLKEVAQGVEEFLSTERQAVLEMVQSK